MRSSTKALFVCCGLIAAVWLVFGRTLGHDFVNYDDDVYVYQNAEVTVGLTLQGIGWAFSHFYAGNWHPLTWLSHMLDCELWGLRPAGHHFTNVLLHSLNAALLFLVLRNISGAFWRSAVVAALFALHPLRVESVAWIAERKDVLSGMFFILTLAAYIHYVRKPTSSIRYLLVAVTLLLGLMSKPSLVVTPLVLLLLDYWPLERFPAGPVRRQAAGNVRRCSIGRLIGEKLPLLGLCVATSALTLFAQKYSVTVGSGLPLGSRIANAVVSYAAYLGQMFWPTRLAVLYPHPGATPAMWRTATAFIILGVISWAVFGWANRRYLITGWLWYLGMLVPMIGLIQVGFQARADRYTYLSHIGLYIMLVWGIADAFRSLPNQRQLFLTAATSLLLLLAVCSYRQCSFWHDSESLWLHVLSVTSANAVAHNNLGNFYLDHGRLDDALRQYQDSLKISAPSASHSTKLGLMERAYADAENNLGLTLVRSGQEREGVDCYERVLARFPNNPKAHLNIGNVLLDSGRVAEAVDHYNKSLIAYPAYADAHFNLGNAWIQKGDIGNAIAEYQRAVQIEPDLIQARNNLGIAYLKKGDARNAVNCWSEALRIQPDSIDILNNAGWLLATYPEPSLRDGRKAVQFAQRANQLSQNKNPAILRTVAAAYAETGDFAAATKAAQDASRLAHSQNREDLVQILDDDLAHYREAEPIRTAPTAQ